MIDDELKQIYSSNPRDIEPVETVELSHSRFSETFYLCQDNEENDFKLDDGTVQTFSPFGFSIVMPSTGNQQDLAFVFDNVARLATRELKAAIATPDEPIMLTYRAYIKGDQEQHSTPLTLSMTNISVNGKSISARATRADLIRRKFPFGRDIYFDSRFKGIS